MDAKDLTFGVEFETTMPSSYGQHVGGYHDTHQAHGLAAGWNATRDGSIRPGRGRVACEFVSPILRGADGVRNVVETLKRLKEMGARVNTSCGLHIHVGFDRTNAKAMERLATMVSNMETAIYASTGTRTRENGSWSRSIRAMGDARTATQCRDRYRVLNLSSRRPTVEFRAFAGSLNPIKVVGYVRMCLGLVERALKCKRNAKWVPPQFKDTSPVVRGGVGQTHLCRLFYQLGWTKGRSDYAYGVFDVTDAPTMKSIKAELMRLAKQYDDPASAPAPRPRARRRRARTFRSVNMADSIASGATVGDAARGGA